jgi:DNA-binding MarR family transcriptional regulator
VEANEILSRLEATMSPASLREFAGSLLRLADSLDQNWNPELVRSSFPGTCDAARIERNALMLSFSATKEEHRARFREDAIGADIIGIPAWNILLELFKQFAGGAKVSTKSLQLVSGGSETTALRIIDRLEDRGLLARSQCDADKRFTLINLTPEGVVKVGSVLERLND